MSVVLVATVSSGSFATRLASHLGVPLANVERRHFPDGESYVRFAIDDRAGLLGQYVVMVGAPDSGTSLDEVFRLGSTASQHGARSLTLVIPYFGYSTMERAVRPGEVVTAKTIARQLSLMPRA